MRRFALTLSTLALASALTGCSKPASTEEGSAAPPAEPTPAQQQALLASLPAPYNTGDLANGKTKFGLCMSCHTVTKGGANMTGPHLHGVFGRKAGSVADYKYSDALIATGWTWDAATLDTWLKGPRADVPGTKMTFPGIKEDKGRVDLIAYLKVASSDPK